MKNYKKQIIAFTAISLLSSTSAFALNEQDFADKLAAVIEYTAAQKVEFLNVEKKGKDIIITGIKSTSATEELVELLADNEKLMQLLSDTTIVFKKVKENKDGSYSVKSASFENVDFTDEEISVKVNDIIIGDILIPANPEENILDTMLLYGAFNVGKISIASKGEQVFEVDNISVTNKANKDKSEFVSAYEVNGIYADLSKVEDEEVLASLSSFGLKEINAKMYGEASWTLDDGRLLIKESVVDIKNIGKFNVTMDILGYTLDVMKRMYDDQKELTGLSVTSPEYEAKNQAMLMTMI
ncbi:MAG: hypothetical protein L3J32_08720 [Rhizobiaceae bacterium]|nr:hypothetical protein [Rhizobiaceae bacterium]